MAPAVPTGILSLDYLLAVRERFQDNREKYERFLQLIQDFHGQRFGIDGLFLAVKELFGDHRELIRGFCAFLPEDYQIAFEEINGKGFKDAWALVNAVNERFHGDPRRNPFFRILRDFRREGKTVLELHQAVAAFFRNQNDLLERFMSFFPPSSPATETLNHVSYGSSLTDRDERVSRMPPKSYAYGDEGRHIARNGMEGRDRRSHEWNEEVLEHDNWHLECQKNPSRRVDDTVNVQLHQEALWNEGHMSRPAEQLDIVIDRELGRIERQNERDCKRECKKGERFSEDLDLSKCQRCTPSYRFLPKNYPTLPASGRSESEASVLNDILVSVTDRKEEYSFKHKHKNKYEKILFKCEDDRFELDMLFESLNVTAKRVEQLLENMQDKSCDPDQIRVEDHLSSSNMRCIELLYGDHGPDMMDILRNNASRGLPVLLARLKKMQEECSRRRPYLDKVWAEVFAKNHLKSLDCRSRYFKRYDMKNLNVKALLAGIREISEKMKQDDVLLNIAFGMRLPHVSHMEFKYIDQDIHEDLYNIIRYSCGELCTSKDQVDNIMHIWITFFQPMVGVLSRSCCLRYHASSNGDCFCADAAASDIMRVNPFSGGVYSLPQEQASSFRARLVNGNTSVKENGFGDVDRTLLNRKVQNVAPITNKKSGITIQDACTNRLADNASIGRTEQSYIRTAFNNTTDADSDSLAKMKNNTVGWQYQVVHGELVCSREDRENASETGEDVSVSEFFDEGCFCEENEGGGQDQDQDAKAGSEDKNERVVDAHDAEVEGISLPFSEHLHTAKPLAMHLPELPYDKEAKTCRIFYGNDSFYVLFRLHQILYERILSAKTKFSTEGGKWRSLKDTSSPDLYAKFMNALFNVLDGSTESKMFEDECLAIFGPQSYVLFTLDKLICKLVKQLQVIASDEMANKFLQLYGYEKSRRHGRSIDLVYQENAHIVHNSSIFRFEYFPNRTSLSIQLMEYGHEKAQMAPDCDPNFSDFFYNDFLSSFPDRKKRHGIFLERNKRKYENEDEYSGTCKGIEGIRVINGLECMISCHSSKIWYVLGTEDLLFRMRKKRRYSCGGSALCHDS